MNGDVNANTNGQGTTGSQGAQSVSYHADAEEADRVNNDANYGLEEMLKVLFQMKMLLITV